MKKNKPQKWRAVAEVEAGDGAAEVEAGAAGDGAAEVEAGAGGDDARRQSRPKAKAGRSAGRRGAERGGGGRRRCR